MWWEAGSRGEFLTPSEIVSTFDGGIEALVDPVRHVADFQSGLTARGRNAIFSTDVFCRSELAIHAASPSGSSQAAQLAA